MKKAKTDNEKGFILVLALVTMVAMTVIGVSLMMNMSTDMLLSRNERDSKKAFQLADAGINDAIARLKLPSTNPRYIGELNTDAGYRTTGWNNGNSLSKDFGLGYGANRESTDGLDYKVEITYLIEGNPEGFCDSNEPADGANGSTNPTSSSPPAACSKTSAEVVMYGQDFNIDSSVSGISYGILPVYKIKSVGTANGTTREIEAYAGASALNTDTGYGINTNNCIAIAGGANNLGVVKQGNGCGCDSQIVGSCDPNKTTPDDLNNYLGEELTTVIDMADEIHRCKNSDCTAPGDDIPSSGSIDTVVSDWGDPAGDTYSTLIYIDNSGGKAVSLSGNFSGRGILVIAGDLDLSGTLTYEGLVYVFGTLKLSGGGSSLNVTGGIMAGGQVNVNGNITVNYDQDTLMDVSRQSSSSAILIWKRL